MSESTSDEGLYDFADEPESANEQKPLHVENIPVAKAVIVAPQENERSKVLSYRRVTKQNNAPVEPEVIKDFYLPIGLLGGGILVEIVVAVIWDWRHLFHAMTRLTVELTLGTTMMMVAMLITAKLRGIDLGNLGTAALKLAAISVAPAAVMKFILPIENYLPLGGIIGWVGEFILFFALLGALFDLQEEDTWYCIATMFFTQVAFYFGMRAFLSS